MFSLQKQKGTFCIYLRMVSPYCVCHRKTTQKRATLEIRQSPQSLKFQELSTLICMGDFILIKRLRVLIVWMLAIGLSIAAYRVAQDMMEPLPEHFKSPYMHGVSNGFQSKTQYLASMRRAFLQCVMGALPLLLIFDYAAVRQRKTEKITQTRNKLSGFSFAELGGIYVLMECAWFMFSHSGVVIRFVPSTWRPNPHAFYSIFALVSILWLGVFLYKAVILSNEIDRSKDKHTLPD